MTFESRSVLLQLLELQQQIIDAAGYAEALEAFEQPAQSVTGASPEAARTARGLGVVTGRIGAILDAERNVRAMAVTTARIREQVVPADGLGPALESLSELMLRAARMVVLTELDTLRGMPDDATNRLTACSLWAPFDNVDDLSRHVSAGLQQITNEWTLYRGVAASDREAYRAALRTAHASMRHLGAASTFAAFLRAARTRSESPVLRMACARIHAALALRTEVDPDVPLLVHAKPFVERSAERAS